MAEPRTPKGGPEATFRFRMPLLVPNEAYMISKAFPGQPRQDHDWSSVPFGHIGRRRRDVLALGSTNPTL